MPVLFEEMVQEAELSVFRLSDLSGMLLFNLKKYTCYHLSRDGMGREEGGGFRMGNTCVPVADSF